MYYSPCEGNPNAEEHYKQLSIANTTIPKHNVLLTIGDFNAHLSESNFNIYTYNITTNTNGKLVIDYAEEANLEVTHTNVRQRHRKLWTYMSGTNGTKTQVGFILIRNKWKNSVKNCEVYSNYSSIRSDHRIVRVTICPKIPF